MKEILARNYEARETRMKKTVIVVALAMALVFVFAAPAFAKYAGYSSSKQYVPWAEAQSLASQNADAALMATNDVNIGSWYTGRAEPGGHTLTVLTLDQPVDDTVLDELRQLEFVRHARQVEIKD
jgi:hypothetical protein